MLEQHLHGARVTTVVKADAAGEIRGASADLGDGSKRGCRVAFPMGFGIMPIGRRVDLREAWEVLRLYVHANGSVRWGDLSRAPPAPEREWRDQGTFRVDVWRVGIHPEDRARLPRGSIAGHPERQRFGMGGPHLLYLDRRRRCRDCGAEFVFTARLQQSWYEERQLWNEVEAVRCAPCRRKKRGRRAAWERLMTALADLAAAPEDPARNLAAAEATLACADDVGDAAIDRAVGFARRSGGAERSSIVEAELKARRVGVRRGPFSPG